MVVGMHVASLGGAPQNLWLGPPSSRVLGLAGAFQTGLVMCPLSLDGCVATKRGAVNFIAASALISTAEQARHIPAQLINRPRAGMYLVQRIGDDPTSERRKVSVRHRSRGVQEQILTHTVCMHRVAMTRNISHQGTWSRCDMYQDTYHTRRASPRRTGAR